MPIPYRRREVKNLPWDSYNYYCFKHRKLSNPATVDMVSKTLAGFFKGRW